MEIFVIGSKTKHSVFSLNHLVAAMFTYYCYLLCHCSVRDICMDSTEEDPVLDLYLLSWDMYKND